MKSNMRRHSRIHSGRLLEASQRSSPEPEDVSGESEGDTSTAGSIPSSLGAGSSLND